MSLSIWENVGGLDEEWSRDWRRKYVERERLRRRYFGVVLINQELPKHFICLKEQLYLFLYILLFSIECFAYYTLKYMTINKLTVDLENI